MGFTVVIDFVVVEVGEGVPQRRVSRHIGRDVRLPSYVATSTATIYNNPEA